MSTQFTWPLILAGLVAITSAHDHVLQTKFFTTPLDHFAPTDARTVNMTYVQMTDYYRDGGPLFVYVQEGDRSTTEFLHSGLMYDIARELGAALVSSDLRYFHSNLPTANASLAHLQHLTVEQIVHDQAQLIRTARTDLRLAESARVVLWGRGLGAQLATWTRQKFPHLVYAVWSSSGVYEPVLHTQRPFEHLAEQIRHVGGQRCEDAVAQTFEQFEQAMLFGEVNPLRDHLGLCSAPIYWYDEDVANFFAGVTQLIVEQINERNVPAIRELCNTLTTFVSTNATDPDYAAFALWVRKNYEQRVECLDLSYFSRVFDNELDDWEDVRQYSWADDVHMIWPHVSRPQMYLTCTQLAGTVTTVNSVSRTFGHQIGHDMLFAFCSEAFGPEYRYEHLAGAVRSVAQTFGGAKPRVTRVLYTNGELDAWWPLGVVDGDHVDDVITIARHGQSADLYSVRATDAIELVRVKDLIRRRIREWVGVH